MRTRAVLAAVLLVLAAPAARAGATPAPLGSGCPRAGSGTVHDTAPGRGRTVALTFDDGPGPDTGRILDILAAAHVPATFFDVGTAEAQRPALVRAVARAHAVGDHTWNHEYLPGLDAAGQARALDRAADRQQRLVGARTCLLRPPGGSYDATTLELARQRHLQVWLWSVDTEDWKAAGSPDPYWVHRIRARAIAGGDQRHPVVLMHDQPGGNPATVAALPGVIRWYRAHGYRFVDLLGDAGPPVVRQLPVAAGSTAGGTRLRLLGTDLRGVREVRFGSLPGTGLRLVSDSEVDVTAPAHAAGTAPVQVVSDHGVSVRAGAVRYRWVAPVR